MDLSPLPADSVDRRLIRHLAADELVLWQGAPKPGSIVSRLAPWTALFTAVVGILFIFGYPPQLLAWIWSLVDSVLQPAVTITKEALELLLIVLGWLLLITSALRFLINQRRHEKHWLYAITSQRLLALNHGRIKHAANRAQADQIQTRKKPFRGHSVSWSSSVEGFRGQEDPQALKALIGSWRAMTPAALQSAGTGSAAAQGHAAPPAAAGRGSSGGGFQIEKDPAVWMAVVGLLGIFGYWGYVHLLSGHTITDQKLQVIASDNRPVEMASLPDGAPDSYWMGPFHLDPAANPVRVVLNPLVRHKGTVSYRLMLLAENGMVAWESSGSFDQRPSRRDRNLQTRRVLEPLELFAIERAGSYLLLADISGVAEAQLRLRGNVAMTHPLIHALFAMLGLAGLAILLRRETERRREARRPVNS